MNTGCNFEINAADYFSVSNLNKADENIWVYRDDSGKNTAWIPVLLFAALSLMLIVTHWDIGKTPFQFSVIILFFIGALFVSTERTTIKIDRREATVKKTHKVFFLSQTKTYSLLGFNSVRLVEKAAPVEEGYINIVYSIILQGNKSSLELFSLEDEKQVQSFSRELSSFLKFTS
ncbi:MAG: hypothetical protein WC853_09700 [Thermodesulfovibrionales bacterium]